MINGHGDLLGLSKRDKKLLKETVEGNPVLLGYARGLNALTDGYIQPTSSWLSGNISTDMYQVSHFVSREQL